MIEEYFKSIFDSTAISDFLWAAATSELALAPLGVVILIAGVVGYLPIVSTLLGGYAKLAKLIFIVALTAMVFLLGFRTADNRAEAKVLKDQIAAKDGVIAAKNFDLHLAHEMADTAEKQRDEAAQRAKNAQDEINDYAKRLKSHPNAACLLTIDDFPDRLSDDRQRK